MSESSDDEPLPKRVCATRAKSQLGATEGLLRTLDCERVRNPHYRSAAPMRLYDTEEVQEAVRNAQARKAYREEFPEIVAAEKLTKQKEIAKEKSEVAAQACAQFSQNSACRQEPDAAARQSTKLPIDVWSVILQKLCPAKLTPLEGTSVIARNIINAQLACHDCHKACEAAWHTLAALLEADYAQCTHTEASPQPAVVDGPIQMPNRFCHV